MPQIFGLVSSQSLIVPPGTILSFSGPVTSPPAGYLYCDGSAVSRTAYSGLFSAIGTAHGVGDQSSTFNLPDFRGRFLRGTADLTGRDPDTTSRGASGTSSFILSGSSITNGSSSVTVSSTANLSPGMTVSGTGIPASSVVRVINSPTTFTLGDLGNTTNVNATSTATVSLTFSTFIFGNYLGSVQTAAFSSHHHMQDATDPLSTHIMRPIVLDLTGAAYNANFTSHNLGNLTPYAEEVVSSTAKALWSTGGNETRPLNSYVNYIVKY